MSSSVRPPGLQHATPPCPSPTPRAYSHSGASSRWCHPAISSSIVPFSSCLQSFPASRSFPMRQLIWWPKYWSFSTSPSSKHSRLISFRMDWLDLLAVQGTLKSFLQLNTRLGKKGMIFPRLAWDILVKALCNFCEMEMCQK